MTINALMINFFVSRRIGRAKLCRINLEHPLVGTLREHEEKVSLQTAEKEALGLGNNPSEVTAYFPCNLLLGWRGFFLDACELSR